MLTFRSIPESPLSHPLAEFLDSMDFLDLENGPWVAGGAALAIMRGKRDLSNGADIDIFCRDKEQEDFVVEWLKKQVTPFDALDCKTAPMDGYIDFYPRFQCSSGKVVCMKTQVIVFQQFGSVSQLLSDFDFTISMMVYDKGRIGASEATWKDFDHQRLRLADNRTTPQGKRYKTVWRMSKYCDMGFTPDPGLVNAVVSASIDRIAFHIPSLSVTPDGNY